MNKNINSKILLFLSVLLLFMLVVGLASAAEDTDTVSNETVLTSAHTGVDTVNTVNQVSVADTISVGSDTGNELLTASGNNVLSDGEKTFDDLKSEIEVDSTIILSGSSYIYSSGQAHAINVTGKIIEGNGATIDSNNINNVYPFYCSGNLTLKNINFINVKQGTALTNFQGGPVRFADNSNNITFDGCTFSGITTTVKDTAGAIGINAANNVCIKNCIFHDNTYYNSLIISYPSQSDNVTVENCQFYSNIANNTNGDLYFNNVNNLTIRNCNFTNEKPKLRIINVGSGSQRVIEDCVFDNNTIATACMEIAGSDTTIKNCVFDDNTVGNAVIITSGANSIIKNCNFTNNTVVQGVMRSTGSYATISNCNFINTTSKGTASTHPSSIFVSGSYSTLNNCNITNSKSTTNQDYNGAVYWTGSYGKIYNVNFTDCHSNSEKGDGGAITIISGTYNTVSECTFNCCTVGNIGGAIFIGTQYNNVTSCVFNDCSSPYGGAIYTSSNHNNFVNCNFTDCNASSRGSAICIEGNVNNIIKCNFKDCVNTYDGTTTNNNFGGAVTLTGQSNVVSESNFTDCSSLFNGGAIFYNGTMGTIDSCTFNGNTATANGDAIYSTGNNLNILNSKFTNNGEEALNIASGTYYYLKNNTGLTDSNVNVSDDAVSLEARDFYISLTGTGEGQNSRNPTNLTYAYQHIASGYTIYLTENIYDVTNIYSGARSIQLYKDDIVIDGQGYTLDFKKANFIFQIYGSNITIKNLDFTNNVNTVGHLIYMQYYCKDTVIDNCRFINKSGSNTGSCAIYLRGTNNKVINCIFSDIRGGVSSAVGGAAIRLETTNGCLVDNCNFTNVSGSGRGGTIALAGSNYDNITNCNFINSMAYGTPSGCAINFYGTTCTHTYIYNCNFTDCHKAGSSTPNGGAIELFSAYSVMDHCTFINNEGNLGGAVVLWQNAHDMNITNCIFINNRANEGGAIGIRDNSDYKLRVENCTFINNTATNRGGAIKYDASDSIVINSNFINNTATNNGGAVFFAAEKCNISDSNFTNNNASNGGAVYYGGSYCVLSDSILINNSASVDGGAIYFDGSNCNLTGSIMEFNNASGAGGAVKFTGTGCNITYCNFTNNTAVTHGGAVHFNGTNSSMEYCFYTNNTCIDGDGGALCSQASGSTVAHCNFTGRNNTAKTGNDFYAHTGCTITFIGLKFTTLWLTNETYYDQVSGTWDTDVAHGYGTGWERPACWDNDDIWLNFLETSENPTIYLVGEITSLPEKSI